MAIFTFASTESATAAKKRAMSGRAKDTVYGYDILWSYSKKTDTLTIGNYNKKPKAKLRNKDFKYWSMHAKNLKYKKNMSELPHIYDVEAFTTWKGSELNTVVIPGTIKIIHKHAFEKCVNLRKAKLGEGVEYIEQRAFSGISKVNFPCSLRCIREEAFSCSKMKEVKLNEGLEFLDTNAFLGSKVRKVILPDSLKYIGFRPFAGCDDIEEIGLPRNIRVIGRGALDYKPKLKNIYIPDSVIKIEDCVFCNSGFESITIPRNVEVLGDDVEYKYWVGVYDHGLFRGCSNLKKITFTTKKLKKVFPGAMIGIDSNVVIEVPEGYKQDYKEKFIAAGLSAENVIVEIPVNDSDLDSVSLNKTEIKMKAETTRHLELLCADEPEKIIWISSDENIVSVDLNGNVEGKSVGSAQVKAQYKEKEYICYITITQADVNNDAEELKLLIKNQIKNGAFVSTDINDKYEYKWKDGRLIGINWHGCRAYGEVDLNVFNKLQFFICGGDFWDPYGGDDYCNIWKIEADDLKELRFIGCADGHGIIDLIHTENSKDVEISFDDIVVHNRKIDLMSDT